jgi:hypothetical protein
LSFLPLRNKPDALSLIGRGPMVTLRALSLPAR